MSMVALGDLGFVALNPKPEILGALGVLLRMLLASSSGCMLGKPRIRTGKPDK